MRINRTISAILVIIFFFASIPFVSANENVKNTEESGLLQAIGIISEQEMEHFIEGYTVGRAEFMKYASLIAGLDPTGLSSDRAPFSDLTAGNSYYSYVLMMESLNIISGKGYGMFFPEEQITYLDALVTMIKLLGYDVYAMNKGGYPSGYYSTASSVGLTKKISAKQNQGISGQDLIMLLFNSLQTPVLTNSGYSNSNIFSVQEGATLLESVFNVYKGAGILEENEKGSVWEANSRLSENCVKIDGEIYQIGETNCKDYLGLMLKFYYKYDKSIGTCELIWVKTDYENRNSLSLTASQIEDVKDNVVMYSYDDGRIRYANFTGLTDVIYNGTAYPTYNEIDLQPDIGSLFLADNDSDGKYDVIQVLSYESKLVQSVNILEEIIFFKDGTSLNLGDGNKTYQLSENGNPATLDEVLPNHVLTIAGDSDDNYYDILISSSIVEGEISLIDIGKRIKVTIGDNVYPLVSASRYIPEISDKGMFYLDAFGNLVDKDDSMNDEQYGFLIKIHTANDFSEEVNFRILTYSGIKLFPAATKISVNESPMSPPIEAIENDDIWQNGLKNSNGETTEQQLIRFKVNANGAVSHITTHADNSGLGTRKADDDTAFALDYIAPDAGLYYRAGTARVFGAKYLVTAQTMVFTVPPVFSSDEQLYKARNIAYFSNDRLYKNLEFYDVNSENITGAIVVKSSLTSATNISNYDPALVVTRITECFENNIPTYKVIGYMQGKIVEYTAYDPQLIDNDEEYGNGIYLKDLNPGDVIQVAGESGKTINEMRVLFQYSNDKVPGEVSGANQTYMHMGLYSAYTKIVKRTSRVLVINGYNYDDITWDKSFQLDPLVYVYKVETGLGKVTPVSVFDLIEGENVYVQASYSKLQTVVFYAN